MTVADKPRKLMMQLMFVSDHENGSYRLPIAISDSQCGIKFPQTLSPLTWYVDICMRVLCAKAGTRRDARWRHRRVRQTTAARWRRCRWFSALRLPSVRTRLPAQAQSRPTRQAALGRRSPQLSSLRDTIRQVTNSLFRLGEGESSRVARC